MAPKFPKLPKIPRIPLRSLGGWALYPAFFVLCFVLFSYWTFPYDAVRDRLIEEASKRGYELEIIELSPSRLTGATLSGVRLVLPSDGAGDAPPLDFVLDEVTVRAGIIAMLQGKTALTFDAELANGEAEGDIELGKENEMTLDITLDEIDLGRIPALRQFTKVPVQGVVTGEVVLDMPTEVKESTGNVDLTIAGLKIGDGKTKIDIPGWGGLTIDEADAGNLELQATIEDGSMDLTRLQAHGTDLKIDATGNVRLSRSLSRSQLDLLARLKVEDAYKKKSAKIASALELASARPEFKSAQTADGALQYRLAGSLAGRLRPRAAGNDSFDPAK